MYASPYLHSMDRNNFVIGTYTGTLRGCNVHALSEYCRISLNRQLPPSDFVSLLCIIGVLLEFT